MTNMTPTTHTERYSERDSFEKGKELQIIERERMRGKIIVIFAYPLESVF